MTQTANDPASVGALPGLGSNIPVEDIAMNNQTNTTNGFSPLVGRTGLLKHHEALAESVEELRRATALVRTVWLALDSPNFDETDTADVSNSLYSGFEILQKIVEAVNAANGAALDAEIERRAAV